MYNISCCSHIYIYCIYIDKWLETLTHNCISVKCLSRVWIWFHLYERILAEQLVTFNLTVKF